MKSVIFLPEAEEEMNEAADITNPRPGDWELTIFQKLSEPLHLLQTPLRHGQNVMENSGDDCSEDFRSAFCTISNLQRLLLQQ